MTPFPKLPKEPALPKIGGAKRPSGWAAYNAKKKLGGEPPANPLKRRYGTK